MVIECEDATSMVRAAQDSAAAEHCNVSIAVVDEAGQLLAFVRMDGASPASAEMAIAKARTAATGRRSTASYESMLNEGRTSLATAPTLTCIEGGIPLQHAGEWLGAIGVSGVSSDRDAAIALAGARLIASAEVQ
ncbi:heme-binding protein [Pseudomonas putida]|uniref:GlcG/HbpS family heme-binding protein n=1 Tax=Pseudomonas putida TaxID=303 RepID=UPI00300EC604